MSDLLFLGVCVGAVAVSVITVVLQARTSNRKQPVGMNALLAVGIHCVAAAAIYLAWMFTQNSSVDPDVIDAYRMYWWLPLVVVAFGLFATIVTYFLQSKTRLTHLEVERP